MLLQYYKLQKGEEAYIDLGAGEDISVEIKIGGAGVADAHDYV